MCVCVCGMVMALQMYGCWTDKYHIPRMSDLSMKSSRLNVCVLVAKHWKNFCDGRERCLSTASTLRQGAQRLDNHSFWDGGFSLAK